MNGIMQCANCQARFKLIERHGATHVACPRCQQVQPIQTLINAAASPANDQPPTDAPRSAPIVEWIAQYLPSWGTSVLVHMALLLVCMAATWVIMNDPPKIDYTSNFIAPERRNITYEPPQSTQSPYESQVEAGTFTFTPTDRPIADLADNRLRPTEFFSTNAGSYSPGGMIGWRPPSRTGNPDGMFTVNTGQPPTAKIVYIVDRSGSMTDSFMPVQKELQRAIQNLKPANQFHVIFYSDGPGLEMPTRRLLPATAANKQAAFDFISQTFPQGGTDPSDALNKAFRLRPDVIYLLSDGEFAPEIITQIRQLNRDKQVTVNTICFLYIAGADMLMKIAAENGGVYKYIDIHWVTQNVN